MTLHYLCACGRLMLEPGNCGCRTQARGTNTSRGYGTTHQRERRRYARILAATPLPCTRCGEPVHATNAWDLDHDDNDRSRYLGPAHSACNRRAGQPRRFFDAENDDPALGFRGVHAISKQRVPSVG